MATNDVTINVQATLEWVAKQTERSGRWIAVCDPLGIAIEGDSPEELQSLMAEATHLLFTDLFDDNELDQFLRDRGWTANLPRKAPAEDVTFRVPMELVIAQAANGAQQRAH